MSETGSQIQIDTPDEQTTSVHIPRDTAVDSQEESQQTSEAAPEGNTQVEETHQETSTETPVENLKIQEGKQDPLQDLFSSESIAKMQQEVQDNNWKFTEDHYKSFEAKGIPREFADAYLAGQKAQADAVVSQVAKECGGMEQLQSTLDWAAKNLDPQTIVAVNQQLASMNADLAITAIKGLQARAGLNTNRTLQAAAGSGNTNTTAFRDEFEFKQAMADPRFDKSPAYRAEVMAKAKAAARAGNIQL